MDLSFWQELGLLTTVSVVTSVSALAFFWALLQKGLEKRMDIVVEQRKAEFASNTHESNTVFSRLDQTRADMLLKLDGEMRAVEWSFLKYHPGDPFAERDHSTPPFNEMFAWTLQRKNEAEGVVKTALVAGLFLPEPLIQKITGSWYHHTVSHANELLDVMHKFVQRPEVASQPVIQQRLLLGQYFQTYRANAQMPLNEAKAEIRDEIRSLFLGPADLPPFRR